LSVDFTLATPNKCYLAALSGIGNGDFSQSLVRHKALTDISEAASCYATSDPGNVISVLCVA